jgi:hypothetical protein
MAQQKTPDGGIRLLRQIALAMAIWLVTTVGAIKGLDRHDASAGVRALLAAVGILGFLPWVFVVRKAIFLEDEFNQRIHLIAIAATFALTGTGSFAVDMLHRAHLVPELPVTGLWIWMGVAWWISIMATARFYR